MEMSDWVALGVMSLPSIIVGLGLTAANKRLARELDAERREHRITEKLMLESAARIGKLEHDNRVLRKEAALPRVIT